MKSLRLRLADRLPCRPAARVARRRRGFLIAAAAIAAVALSALRAEADGTVTANVVGTTLTVTGDALDNEIDLYVDFDDDTKLVVSDLSLIHI